MQRLGISVPLDDSPLSEVGDHARRAEGLGYTDCWSFENAVLDAFTPLAAAAAATERMRLGTAIVPVFTRPPGLIAMHACALAELAPGRFVLGLGSSTKTVVETWMGIPFGRPRSRVVEVAGVVRRLLDGEKVGALRLARPPAQRVPIFIAGLGPKMLAAAGELADGICLFMTGPRIIPELIAGAGGGVDSMLRLPVLDGPDPAAVRAQAARFIVSYALVPYYAAVMQRQGFGDEVAGIAARWSAGDRAGAPGMVSDAMISELLLTGDVDAMRSRLAEYRAAGLGCAALAISIVTTDPLDRRRRTAALLESLAGA